VREIKKEVPDWGRKERNGRGNESAAENNVQRWAMEKSLKSRKTGKRR